MTKFIHNSELSYSSTVIEKAVHERDASEQCRRRRIGKPLTQHVGNKLNPADCGEHLLSVSEHQRWKSTRFLCSLALLGLENLSEGKTVSSGLDGKRER